MALNVVSQEKLHSICALLEQEGVGGNIIEEFKRSLRESGLPVRDQRGTASTGTAQTAMAATPTRQTNASPSLSPIQLERFNLSPSSFVGFSSSRLRHAGSVLKERGECFDRERAAVNYDRVAVKNMERTSRVQKLLRSPRPPTPEEKMQRSRAGADCKFDHFSEHDPKMRGLQQLYIPPPSPKVARQIDASALFNSSFHSIQSDRSSSKSVSSPTRGFAARPVQKSIPFLLEQRFDDFPDHNFHYQSAQQEQRNAM